MRLVRARRPFSVGYIWKWHQMCVVAGGRGWGGGQTEDGPRLPRLPIKVTQLRGAAPHMETIRDNYLQFIKIQCLHFWRGPHYNQNHKWIIGLPDYIYIFFWTFEFLIQKLISSLVSFETINNWFIGLLVYLHDQTGYTTNNYLVSCRISSWRTPMGYCSSR